MGADGAWESLLERSISAFYEGHFAEGRLACDRLLCLPDLPANVRAVTRTNQAHYAQDIGEIAASYQEPVISRVGSPEPAWCRSWAELHPDAAALQSALALLDHGNANDLERWPSVVVDGALYVMASIGPTAVVRRDATTGAITLEAFHDAPFVARDLHGGTRLVATGDGFLALAYDVVTWEEGNQTYLHRFVRFDHAFQMTHLSHPFRLHAAGVEAACGLAREGDALALAYRVDRDCLIASLDLTEALALLQPIELLAPHGAHPFAMPEDLLRVLQQWDRSEAPGVNPVDASHIPSLRPETVIDVMQRQGRAIGVEPDANKAMGPPLLRGILFPDSDPYLDFPLADHPPDLQGWSAGHPMFERVIRQLRPRRIIEVGSWKGASAIAMARLCQEWNVACEEIVCVDTWLGGPENVIEVRPSGATTRSPWFSHLRHRHGYPQLYFTFVRNVIDAGFAEIITPLPLSSDSAATVLKRCGYVAELVYIDAGHEYESVRADLQNYWPLIAPGGILLGDDYANPEQPGVRRAVDEFCLTIGAELSADAFTYAIVKPSRA